MDIKIPKEITRFTSEVIEKLYDKGFFDDTDTMHDKHIGMKNDVPQKFYKRPVKTIGMWMSGGADSSICAYMICKQIKEKQENAQKLRMNWHILNQTQEKLEKTRQ